MPLLLVLKYQVLIKLLQIQTKTELIAASFAVNEDLSVSWGMSTVEFENPSLVDQEDSVSSIMHNGSMTIAAAANSSDNTVDQAELMITIKMSIAFALITFT